MSDFYKRFEEAHRGEPQTIRQRLLQYYPIISTLCTQFEKPRAFDIGCGRGEWVELLVECGFQAVGVDLDAGMLASKISPTLELRHGDALEHLETLPDCSQSLISAFHVVEHIGFDDLQRLIELAYKKLAPSGLLLIETPNAENLSVGSYLFYMDPTHLRPIPGELLLFLCQQAQFGLCWHVRLNPQPLQGSLSTPTLYDVVHNSSMDYGVMAFKPSGAQPALPQPLLDCVIDTVNAIQGPTLESLCNAYDEQIGESIKGLSSRLAEIENRPAESFAQGVKRLIPVGLIKLIRKLIKKRLLVPKTQNRKIFVDVSIASTKEQITGTERVTMRYLSELTAICLAPQEKLEVIPVQFSEGNFWVLNQSSGRVALKTSALSTANSGDILWLLDFNPDALVTMKKMGLDQAWKSRGVKIASLVHDVLPVTHPVYFPPFMANLFLNWIRDILEISDTVIAVSQTTAEELDAFRTRILGATKTCDIQVNYSGGDHLENENHTGFTDSIKTPPTIPACKFLLSVGTIEPRKGYLQTLFWLSQAWENGLKITWVIIGSEGWKNLKQTERKPVAKIVRAITQHPEFGKQLFWFSNLSDLELNHFYKGCSALLQSSFAEGFGLPIVEAARLSKPVIARDIPIFREILGTSGNYFTTEVDFLKCLTLLENDELNFPESEKQHHTWQAAANSILKLLR